MAERFEKLYLRLTPDEDGYPPFSVESLWGIERRSDVYQLDNVPHYLYGVSLGDWVLTRLEDGERIALEVVRQGGHSTLRVYVEDPRIKAQVRERLRQMGCKCVSSKGMSLFALHVPAEVDFASVDQYLCALSDGETIAYEDACLQHPAIDAGRRSECAERASIIVGAQ